MTDPPQEDLYTASENSKPANGRVCYLSHGSATLSLPFRTGLDDGVRASNFPSELAQEREGFPPTSLQNWQNTKSNVLQLPFRTG